MGDLELRCDGCLTVHRYEEFLVVAGLVHAVLEELHGFHRRHVGQVAAQDVHAVEYFRTKEHVFFAGSGRDKVNGWPNAAVGGVTELH